MFYLSDWYIKKEYNDKVRKVLWSSELNSILRKIENFSDKHPSTHNLCDKIERVLLFCFHKFKMIWEKRNHLVRYSDKEIYRLLSPTIHYDIHSLCNKDLISYICLLEKYGKKELDTWGFEEKPRKKIGFFKKLWYKITFTVY